MSAQERRQMPNSEMAIKSTPNEMPRSRMNQEHPNGEMPRGKMEQENRGGEMHSKNMEQAPPGEERMPRGGHPTDEGEEGLQNVLVEVRRYDCLVPKLFSSIIGGYKRVVRSHHLSISHYSAKR